MPSSLAPFTHHVGVQYPAELAIAFLLASIFANVETSTKHFLATSAAAWLVVWAYTTLKTGLASLCKVTPAKQLAWAAGGVFALGRVCERAVDGHDIWWAKAILPALVYSLTSSGLLKDDPAQHPRCGSPSKHFQQPLETSRGPLVALTLSSLVVLWSQYTSATIVALGCSYTILQVLAFRLIERAYEASNNALQNQAGVIHSVRGLLEQPPVAAPTRDLPFLAVLCDVSFTGVIITTIAGMALEDLTFGGVVYYGLLSRILGGHWASAQAALSIVYSLSTVAAHASVCAATIILIHRQGALFTSFIPLAAAVTSQLLVGFSLPRLCFAALCALSTLSFLDEQAVFPVGARMRMRCGRLLSLAVIASCVCIAVYYLRTLRATSPLANPNSAALPARPLSVAPPVQPLEPLQYAESQTHPVKNLIDNASASFNAKLRSQSQTLQAAVTEYMRRYGLPPPPHFDKWYEFAKRKNVQLIDEYDTIYHSLLPFWGLSPATIRARAREALGFSDNNLMGVLVRDGKVSHVEGGQDWLQQAVVGMVEQFIQYLPDMDLAFNVHDEPRVVVPHDELSRLIKIALDKNIAAAQAVQNPKDAFSARPQDIQSGKRIAEVKTTRFNVFAHQPTWIPSRLSCSPDSAARGLEDTMLADNMTAYALSELGFVYNQTAFSDVCNSPSFGQSHGFFDRPNAFNVVHDLFPIFSQSKISSFQDIAYPSPWYWFGKVSYDEGKDMDWNEKKNSLWWRGSTTGGFSRAGGWRRQHRQKLVAKINSLEKARIMSSSNAGATDDNPNAKKWLVKEISRPDFSSLMDVHFSHIGQCDPGDCDAQREFFSIAPVADQQEAWNFKYLLDMDGNAFSGRFYAFLSSHSLTFKMAVFREWHEEWIRPWVHFIPLSLKGEEVLETVRYFDAEPEGQELAIRVAEEGRRWARQALRNEDFEVWLFRLLLEYARVVDDARDGIGFVL